MVNAFNGSGTSDGFTFAINGDPKGTNSLGEGGQNLGFFGYDTKGGVKNSYAVLFDMWTTGPVSLLGFSKSDASTIPSANINLPIGLANNSYAVQISYSASRKVLSASVGGKTYEQSVDLQSVVGNSGYIGFTAANGGGTLDTDISYWTANASKFGNTPIIRGNSLYTIVDGPSWTQAEANSVKLGGHLVTVNEASENSFITSSFSNQISDLAFIGNNDIVTEGVWRLPSGESQTYANWANGEPNDGNSTKNEDVAAIYFRAQDFGTVGVWNDVRIDGYGNISRGIAETPFIRRGDSAYVVVQGPTWEEAEANAQALGGHLVTINDGAENEWLVKTFPLSPNWYVYWTGLNDARQEGSFSWISGETSTYTNWRPLSGPNRPAYNKETDLNDYIVLQTNDLNESRAGQWSELDNTYFKRYGNSNLGIAEIKLAPNNIPTVTPSLSGTTKVGQVITIDKTPLQDADNFTGYTPDFKYSWEVSTNGTTWTKLTSTDATDNNTTYTLTTAEVGKKVRGVVSYLDGYGTQESVASTGSSVTSVTVVRGNSLYTIVDGPSWTQAEAKSVKLGGHLVSIENESENAFIINTFDTYVVGDVSTYYKWIGFTDNEQEGVWKWTDGDTTTFTNWSGPQPDNNKDWTSPNGQHYAAIQWYGGAYSGDWDDKSDLSQYFAAKGIAETPFIRRGDSAYVIVQGPTWEEAEANAVKLGGHLVTINDAAENEWISRNYNQKGDLSLYIGLRQGAGGSWIWSDDYAGEGYKNWHPGQPSPGETIAEIILGDLGWANDPNPTGFLNNVPNPSPYASRGLAEIKLAPNNTPTGTPTLSGTTKVGQVITIDRTPIQDADNFTGYTPNFNYTWEVSTNGTTWTKLTTTDASDNNTTYTLTTAEVGKNVRGVVSYLDGYGTNESVVSTASVSIASNASPLQALTLGAPSKNAIRFGINTTSAIAYNVSTGDTALTGIGASLYFDSTQLMVNTAGDLFKAGLLGSAITADTTNADGDPKTDKILALTYADFGGNFPGTGTLLPLTLANLNLVPTTTYSGTTLHLKGTPAVGYLATGADLTLAYNAAPTVTVTLPNRTINRGSAFTYTVPSGLFTDPDSVLTISAKSATGAALPSWLAFNTTTGTFTGTPTSGGTFNIAVAAADELGSVSAPLAFNVREVQSVSSSGTDIRYQRNKDVTVPIYYSITDGSQSTGLSFKVHYNSALFSFDPLTGVSNKATADLFQIGDVQSDTSNIDADISTDKFIPINVASFSGSFPTGTIPIKLADLIFKAADKAVDPLTGLMDTKINFSETEAAQGYGFQGFGASLKPSFYSLDVDGDGKVTALGDGLMVIRKLFGAAFAGDALTNKAISPTATRSTSQIHEFIQQGMEAGYLDVDKDGKTTALGDGLMVIRQLFGAAFAGDALTNKAISTSSPYFGQSNAFSWISGNIEALRMTTL